MEKDSSPLDTLRQLKEWLDAGTITQQEFDVLKQKLLFPTAAPASPASAPPTAPQPDLSVSLGQPIGAIPPAFPITPDPTATIAPIEDPLLPPVTTASTGGGPAMAVPPTPPAATPGFSHPLEAGRPGASPSQEDAFITPAAAAGEEYVEEAPYTAPAKSPLGTILIIGGILLLLGLVAYLMMGNRDSERLSSTNLTAADSLATRPEEGPQSEQIDLPPAAAPETIRVAPVVPFTPAPDSVAAPVTTPAEDASATPVVADESAAQARIEGVLQNYYADLQAAPFSASAYFAPRVERFYLQQNTTPAAITAELDRSHFPEFLEAQSTIEPGTLKVSPPVADGSRVVTFVEKSSALRQSLQKHQQTAAQVRVRFDKNFKIVYLRQEKLLENNFSD
ncbi:SHOCT domain-containing protein [Hymenobacter swuensis]|uniref:SHOCT domain-containing protein n=1 Tax=Hymenobacter swuensis DY53 TaxID=1227739 RepID=W8F2E9_9BACT|nr:SHOCT domain-containing protein [Hymenobacter swuensis]AHJ99108.1 hypothetical protein Hsw_3513 [Hymenobacter swuensis DY53]